VENKLALFPLNTVLVPGAALRLHVFEERYKEMIGTCIERSEAFGVVFERRGRETGEDLEPSPVGTAALIRELAKLPQGRMFIVSRGIARFRVDEIAGRQPYLLARVSYLAEPLGAQRDIPVLKDVARERFDDYLHALLAIIGGDIDRVELPEDAAAASYLVADALQVPPVVKQRLLETQTASDRLRLEIALMEAETQRLRAIKSGEAPPDPSLTPSTPFDVRFSIN